MLSGPSKPHNLPTTHRQPLHSIPQPCSGPQLSLNCNRLGPGSLSFLHTAFWSHLRKCRSGARTPLAHSGLETNPSLVTTLLLAWVLLTSAATPAYQTQTRARAHTFTAPQEPVLHQQPFPSPSLPKEAFPFHTKPGRARPPFPNIWGFQEDIHHHPQRKRDQETRPIPGPPQSSVCEDTHIPERLPPSCDGRC